MASDAPIEKRPLDIDEFVSGLSAVSGYDRDALIELYWTFHPRFRFFKCLEPDALLLDVGAGTGGLAFWKTWYRPDRRDLRLFALDLVKGEHFHEYETFQVCDFEKDDPGFPEGDFDAVFMSHFLEHVSDARAALLKARRLLKVGGILYIEMPTPRTQQIPHKSEFQERGLIVSAANFFEDPTHVRTYEPSEMGRTLREAGLALLEGGLIRFPFIEDDLVALGMATKDEILTTFGVWSKLEWAHWAVGRKEEA